MQDELLAENPATTIRILGCNQIGSESGNAAICTGRDIPWTQDTLAENVWVDWGIDYRDVVVTDVDNVPVAVYNLTTHDLANPTYYAELKQILKDAAGE
jgi:hypothetical protein